MNTLTATLDYDFSALEPVLSKDTIRDHFQQRHAPACAEVLAGVKGTALEPLSLDSLIRLAHHLPSYGHLLRRACLIRNHNFYWRSLQPGGGSLPWGPMADALRDCFGTLACFVDRAQQQSNSLPGSGWLWIIWCHSRIQICTTENATTFPLEGGTVLLAIDLWEHAYYSDFRYRRADYVGACFEKLINWDFANYRLRYALPGRRQAQQSAVARPEGTCDTGSGTTRRLPSKIGAHQLIEPGPWAAVGDPAASGDQGHA